MEEKSRKRLNNIFSQMLSVANEKKSARKYRVRNSYEAHKVCGNAAKLGLNSEIITGELFEKKLDELVMVEPYWELCCESGSDCPCSKYHIRSKKERKEAIKYVRVWKSPSSV